MNLVSSQFDKQDKSIQALTSRNNVLNKEIDVQDKINTLESALKNASESLVKMTEELKTGLFSLTMQKQNLTIWKRN